MAIVFDGATKRITLTAGTTSLSVRDLWSRYCDWLATGDNSKWGEAMRQVGGDTVRIPIFVFLLGAWRIVPQSADHVLNVTDGVVELDGGGDPFVSAVGSWNVRVNWETPGVAIGYEINTGSGLTPSQDDLLTKMAKALLNKMVTDPATGKQVIYDDDGTTVFAQADIFEDAAGTQRYRGQGAERREKLA